MAEQASVEAELLALRSAADKGDLNGCCDATESLLQRLPAPQALELVRQHVERRLPAVERHQPGETWQRDFLEHLRLTDPIGEATPMWPWESDEFSGPGANNFIRGVDALLRARRLTADEPRRIATLVEAISTVIVAEQSEAWGSRHPDQWAYWYESAGTGEADPKRYDILLARTQDPESVRIMREAWLDVADRLAEALDLTGPAPRPG